MQDSPSPSSSSLRRVEGNEEDGRRRQNHRQAAASSGAAGGILRNHSSSSSTPHVERLRISLPDSNDYAQQRGLALRSQSCRLAGLPAAAAAAPIRSTNNPRRAVTLTSTELFSMERADSVQSLGAESTRTTLPSSHHNAGRQQQQQLSSSPMGRSGLYRNAMLAASDSQRSLSSSTRSSPKVSAEEQTERCSRQETQGMAEELRRNLYRNAMLAASDSQRSLKSAESNRSCSLSVIEVEEERHRQELETQRVAEEAQEEELMRLALERSLTETSGSFNFSPTESPVRHQSAPVRPAPGFTGSSSRGVESTVSPPTPPFPLMCETEQQRQQVSADEDDDDDDDDISSMFDLSPHEPVSSAHAVRMQPSCLPPAPSLQQQKNSRPGVTAPPSGPPLPPASTQEPPLQLHLSSSRATPAPPAEDRSVVAATAAGAVSVSSPAPKRKSPRARTAESLQSPSIDDPTKPPIVKGGSAINVDGAVITKSPEVRAAIVKHVTSPPVIHSSPKKSCNVIPPSSDGECSFEGNNDGQQTGTEQSVPQQLAESDVRKTDSKDNPGRAERCCSRAAGDDECKKTLPEKKAIAQSPWKNSKMQAEREAMSSADWPALGEQQQIPKKKEGAKYAKFRQYVDSFQSEEETFDLSGANISSEELQEIERALRESQLCESAGGVQQNAAAAAASSVAARYDFDGAEEHISEEELRKIQEALLEETTPERDVGGGLDEEEDSKPAAVVIDGLSEEDAAAIVQALREAEEEEEAIASRMRETSEEEERRSFELALKIQKEEERLQYTVPGGSRASLQNQGKVRTVTRAELLEYANLGSANDTSYPVGGFDDVEEDHLLAAGFRMNSSARQQWSRRDQNSIVGPNREVRTKHDTALHGQANAHRLGLERDEIAEVGNKAYNSFMQSIKGAKKGVAKAGTGRAGSDTDSTKGGAMDPNVRSVISRAINNEIIEKCNGVVKEGKEAVVYHADQGTDSEGFDVAVKVFKRIQEFRGRGEYVDGDPRYGKTTFKNVSNREQLELWTEKEFRNLMRANKAGVPVPSPLFYKENVLFMRFLGSDGWPAPQLRELDLRRGSKRWTTLYIQVLDAMKR